MAKLREKQQRFVDEYLIDLNGTQAAIRAGYSPKTAAEQASRLLRDVKVQEAVDAAMARRSRRTGVTQDRIVKELARIGFLIPDRLVDMDDATVRGDASEDDLACIQSVKVKRSDGERGSSVEREVRFHDKLRALELLMRHNGMLADRLDVSVKSSQKLDDIMSQIGSRGLDE